MSEQREMLIDQRKLEMAYLSAAISEPGVLDLLKASPAGVDLFECEFCIVAATRMLSILEQGMDLDTASLMAAFVDAGEPFSASDMADLVSAAETPMHASTHFRILTDRWRLRDLRGKAQRLSEIAKSGSWQDIRGKVNEIAASMVDGGTEIRKRSQVEVVEAAISERQRLADGKEPISGVCIYTGIESVDRFCRPLSTATGDFHNLLFAVSSTGKSSLMAQMVAHNAIAGKRIAVFLGETNSEGLYEKMAAQLTRASLDPWEFRNEPRDRQAKFIDCLKGLSSYAGERLWVFDDDFYIEDVIARSRRIAKEAGGLDLVVADHMHVMKSRRTFKDERVRYNYMSGEIKPLGLELGCPTLFLAQPNRSLKTESRPPRKSDLKETGSLEDDADRIWALWLPPKDADGIEQDDYTDCPEVQLHQLKFRNGKTGMVRLRLEKRYTRFFEPTTLKKGTR